MKQRGNALQGVVAPYGSEDHLRALVIRHGALRAPLGLCYTPEELSKDAEYRHFVVKDGARVIANVSLATHASGVGQIKQVVVDPEYQGRDIGTLLVSHVETFARGEGFSLMFLNARQSTKSFYEKLGYAEEGEAFTLVGMPHQRMVKAL